ncbi:type IIL restriction-modification enzyme MmeI, partial [Thiolapillus sp.]
RHLRQAYDEWREALDLEDPRLLDIHQAWVELVLTEGLDLNDEEGDTLRSGERLPDGLSYQHPESGVTLIPDYVVVDDQHEDKPLMLVAVHGPEVDLDSTIEGDGWATSPAERMVQLYRATETRLGLVTNGERWMLVDAPVGAVTTFASWYARLWSQEPMTLQAFVTLLGIDRFFDAKDRRLPALLDDSLQHQDEVTDALGKQVQRAVEVLIQSLDRANHDRNQELLKGIPPGELYEAALTVMMRLVFLLSAEERELMDVVKDERFQAYYAVSSLRIQLREQAELHSEEILSHRRDAWSRLLAIFRAIYGGIEHEALRMPALGGSLFDPDRFPFLKGRTKGTSWRTDEARPLPIDNRTVLLLLDAIQLFQGRTLSYRALDIESIGHVYEGLLEHTVECAKDVILDLDATKS